LNADFAEEFTPEGAVLLGNSIGSLTVLSAAAKAGSELFKYVEYYDFACFRGDMKPGLDRAGGALVELVGIDLANHWCWESWGLPCELGPHLSYCSVNFCINLVQGFCEYIHKNLHA